MKKSILHLAAFIGFILCERSAAQSYSVLNIQTTPSTCGSGGSVTASVYVGSECSSGGTEAYVDVTLYGPSPDFNVFNAMNGATLGASQLLPGDYYYHLVGTGNCGGYSDFPFTITENGAAPNISITHHSVDCDDDADYLTITNNATAPVAITDPTGVSWGTIAAGQSINHSVSTYNLILTATSSACTADYPGQYNLGYPQLFANVTHNNATNGLSNGEATLSITGGTFPFTVQWSNGATTNTISNLAAGTYTVIATDYRGCGDTVEVVIENTNSQGIESFSTTIENINIAPNPAKGNKISMNVNAILSQTLFVSVYNGLGQEVVSSHIYDIKAGNNQLSLPLNTTLDLGMYMLKVITTDNTVGCIPLLYLSE